jgi:fumarylpyruvate hydrolase
MDLFVSNALKVFPKVVCVGKNYLDHVKEMGGFQAPVAPVIFLKPWSSVNYNPKLLALPTSALHRVDHELELGVYIEKGGKNIAKEEAMAHVGGYFIGIDFTDRGKSLLT